MDITKPVTGLSLKLLRVARRVEGQHVAAVMGVHRSRVSAIEASSRPTPEMVARYVAALDTCAPSPTGENV